MTNIRRMAATVTASAVLALAGIALAAPCQAQSRGASPWDSAAVGTVQNAPAVGQILQGASYLVGALV